MPGARSQPETAVAAGRDAHAPSASRPTTAKGHENDLRRKRLRMTVRASRMKADPAGFEPAVSSSAGWCPNPCFPRDCLGYGSETSAQPSRIKAIPQFKVSCAEVLCKRHFIGLYVVIMQPNLYPLYASVAKSD